MSESHELTPEDSKHLERLEEELWREETRFDSRRMEAVIGSGFLRVWSISRVYRRDDTLAVSRET